MTKDVVWIDANLCEPPHKITHPEKLESLVGKFRSSGWGSTYPALIGYPFAKKIQLVSGTHRWNAARQLGMKIPVYLLSYEYVSSVFGTEEWLDVINDPPAARLDPIAMERMYETMYEQKDWLIEDLRKEIARLESEIAAMRIAKEVDKAVRRNHK